MEIIFFLKPDKRSTPCVDCAKRNFFWICKRGLCQTSCDCCDLKCVKECEIKRFHPDLKKDDSSIFCNRINKSFSSRNIFRPVFPCGTLGVRPSWSYSTERSGRHFQNGTASRSICWCLVGVGAYTCCYLFHTWLKSVSCYKCSY